MAAHAQGPVTILPVTTRAGTREFVELAFRPNRGDPAWVPPLKGEALDLLTPGKNPWFDHGRAQLFVARRDGRTGGESEGGRGGKECVRTRRSRWSPYK